MNSVQFCAITLIFIKKAKQLNQNLNNFIIILIILLRADQNRNVVSFKKSFIKLHYIFHSFLVIDGKWSSWSGWTKCLKKCGSGEKRLRTRSCSDPRPYNGGKQCNKSGRRVEFQTENCCKGGWTLISLKYRLSNALGPVHTTQVISRSRDISRSKDKTVPGIHEKNWRWDVLGNGARKPLNACAWATKLSLAPEISHGEPFTLTGKN